MGPDERKSSRAIVREGKNMKFRAFVFISVFFMSMIAAWGAPPPDTDTIPPALETWNPGFFTVRMSAFVPPPTTAEMYTDASGHRAWTWILTGKEAGSARAGSFLRMDGSLCRVDLRHGHRMSRSTERS